MKCRAEWRDTDVIGRNGGQWTEMALLSVRLRALFPPKLLCLLLVLDRLSLLAGIIESDLTHSFLHPIEEELRVGLADAA